MSCFTGFHTRFRVLHFSFVALIITSFLGLSVFSPSQSIGQAHSGSLAILPGITGIEYVSATVPTDAQCRSGSRHLPCYSPQELRNAYGLTPLLNSGFTGAGQSIIIIDSFGSPTIAQDLKTFDSDYGLPDPPSLQVLAPLGTVPYDPNNGDMINWAFETTLDVEWAHAMAPSASIVLMVSPVSETEGVQGMPEFLALEKYALDHHLGKIISQSWGATENTLFDVPGRKVLNDFENFYQRARNENVTVLASSGDTGSTNYELDLSTLYPFPAVGFPASSPLVTAVGGTSLFADTNGNYQSETVWNNNTGATGGGVSQFFTEPGYQLAFLPASDQAILGRHRGIPDLAINADPYTSILVYISITGVPTGYYRIGGTSEGSPEWAGIIADANQLAGRPLGFLNTKLYLLGKTDLLYRGFHDITVGNNSFAGVPGYNATPGWDLTTGWGTPNLSDFIHRIVVMN